MNLSYTFTMQSFKSTHPSLLLRLQFFPESLQVSAGHLFGKFLLLQLGAQVLVAGLKLFGGGGQGLVGVRQGLQMKLGFLQTGLGLM